MHRRSSSSLAAALVAATLALCLAGCQAAFSPAPESAPADSKAVTSTVLAENFNTGTKTSYSTAKVTLSSGSWTFTNALLGTSSSDRKNGAQSARVTSTGKLTMNFDKTGGAGIVTLYHGIFGSDSSATWELYYSTNQGSTWTKAGSTVTTSSTSLAQASFAVNASGSIRFEIRKTSGTGRLNFDDFAVGDYSDSTTGLSVTPTSASFAAAGGTSSASVTSTVAWTATSSASWLSLSPSSGSGSSTLSMTAAANTGTSSRTATVAVSGSGVSPVTVSVTQAASSSTSVFTEDMGLPQAIRDYYRSAYGLSGTALKAKLQGIITSTHTPKTYAGLWTMYNTTDVAPNGKVWDIYSSTSADGSTAAYWFTLGTDQAGTYSAEGQVYNREHSWPKVTFGGSTSSVPGTDGHHAIPTDGYVNNKRSDYSYGEVGTASWTSQNGSKLGSARSGLGFTGTVFEVIDAYKGDIARMHFYMSLRYYNNSLFASCDWANAGAKLKPWYATMLKSWAAKDPVSAKEIARNSAVQAYQGNRNPFIDYPELINLIDLTN